LFLKGYQEIVTDPANAGKIVVLAYPLIGNYGTAEKFNQSRRAWTEAIIIRENSNIMSNFQAEKSFEEFIKGEKVVVATEVDTRTLAVRIRDKGEMLGIVSTRKETKAELLKKLKARSKKLKRDFIRDASVRKIKNIKGGGPRSPRVGIFDLGVVNGFVGQLKQLGCNITLLPYNTPAEKVLDLKLDGLVISSGLEGDDAVPQIVKAVKVLLGKIPLLGISLGHEVIGLALGGKLKRMKQGHHGVNYPVRFPGSNKGEITVQNHSYVIDDRSIKARKDVKITLRNVNDDSIEELESRRLKFISTQYLPSSPGMNEVHEVFNRFIQMATKKGG
jgi:carbamoyl-phosphate synthase small subunit